jgi:ribosome-binding factor A
MAGKRIARVNEQLKRELTTLLRGEVRDPRIGLVTITDVETSPDLYHAKVHYSIVGDDEERQRVHEGLRAAAGFLRTELGKRMHIRRAPELHFAYDDTLRHAMHIERLLQEARESSAASVAGAEEDDPEESGEGAGDDGAGEADERS